jgi:two-component system LytT family response regulator
VGTAGNYTELHSDGHSHLLRETMNDMEQQLDPAQFIRIHRSRIVRLKCIRELKAIGNREYIVKLSDGSEHRSSRSYADQLERWLSSAER